MTIDVTKNKLDNPISRDYLAENFNSQRTLHVYSGDPFLVPRIKPLIHNTVLENFKVGNQLTSDKNICIITKLMYAVQDTVVDILNDKNIFIKTNNDKCYYYVGASSSCITNQILEDACRYYFLNHTKGEFFTDYSFLRSGFIVITKILEDLMKNLKFFTNLRSVRINTNNMSTMDHNTQWVKRCIIFDRITRGQKDITISRELKVDRRTVASIRKLYKENKYLQYADLKPKRPGPEKNPYLKISKDALGELIEDLTKLPSSFSINSSTWTASAIKEYLQKKHNIIVNENYLYKFFKKSSITSKFGRRVNPNQKQDEKEEFVLHKFKEICLYAKKNGYEILFCDETSCVRKHNKKGYSYKGTRSPVDYNQEVLHTNAGLFTLMSPSGIFKSFSFFDNFNSKKFIEFIVNFHNMFPNIKFLLILDNAKWHKSRDVRVWLEKLESENKKFLEFEWLPPYCPELNPVEYFNNDFKAYLRKHPTKKKIEVIMDVDSYFFDLNFDPEKKERKIKNFFLGESCSYSMTIYHEVFECSERKVS